MILTKQAWLQHWPKYKNLSLASFSFSSVIKYETECNINFIDKKKDSFNSSIHYLKKKKKKF